MRILVAGGAGYIGSHVVRALLERGYEPIAYDNLSTGHAEAVQGAELVVGDVGDSDLLSRTLRKFQVQGAIQLAGLSLVGASMTEPSAYFRENVGGGLSLFDALVRAEIPWVVLSSSAAVYGNPDHVPICEDQVLKPTNPYGESKLMLEKILKWYESAYQFRSTSLRYFNAAGAHPSGQLGEDHTPETHLIPLVLKTALGFRDAVEVFGTDYPTKDGSAVRDYIHVNDLAQAHLAAVEQLRAGCPTASYNLGNEQGFSVLEIIKMAREVTGQQFAVRYSDRRPGDPPQLVAESRLAREKLHWETRFGLQEIIETAWRWHVTHPTGYSSESAKR